MRTLLLNKFDLTPEGTIVECARIGEKGYGENVQYEINIAKSEHGVSIEWYGEDENVISLEEYLELVNFSDLDV